MNKTERQLAILLHLQSAGKSGLRAEDLAGLFETSKRTIYRDIQALSEAGVPLVALPGQGYLLGEGYFLPPLSFTGEEALLLMLGTDFVSESFDEHYSRIAQQARTKIQAVLPTALQEQVADWQTGFRFITQIGATSPYLKELRRAIIERRVVQFEYQAKSSAGLVERKVKPYALVFYAQTWYLTGYCYLRQAIRHFRLERLENLKLLPETFKRPPAFQLSTPSESENSAALVPVKVLFQPQVVRWVKEDRFFFIEQKEELADGCLLVTLKARRLADVLGWVLGWGKAATVLEPAELIELVRQEATALLANYPL